MKSSISKIWKEKIIHLIIIFVLFTSTSNVIYSKTKDVDTIDTNEFIISPIFSGDTVKTIEELKEISGSNTQWDLFFISGRINEFKKIVNIIRYCSALNIYCFDNISLQEVFKILQDSTNNRIGYLMIFDTIHSKIPANISRFNRLKSLSLVCTKLNEFPKEIFELDLLIDIRFKETKFKEMPEGITKLISLNSVTFRYCDIENLSSDFGELNNIRNIDFDECPRLNVSGVLKEISKFRHPLEQISFFKCNIDSMPNEVYSLTKVKSIQITVKSISDEEKIMIEEKYPNIGFVLEKDLYVLPEGTKCKNK